MDAAWRISLVVAHYANVRFSSARQAATGDSGSSFHPVCGIARSLVGGFGAGSMSRCADLDGEFVDLMLWHGDSELVE